MKKEITTGLTWYATEISFILNDSFYSESDAKIKKLKTINDKLIKYLNAHIDILNLSYEEAIELGFLLWEDNLYLIPLYLLPLVPEGTKLIAIDGEEVIYGKDFIDTDIRFGCIAYGIKVKK